MRRSAFTTPAHLYLPYFRRLILRTAAVWVVLRLFTEGARHYLDEADGALPVTGSLLLIGFVLAIDMVSARALRETLFRRNAGIDDFEVIAAAASSLLLLEVLFRVLS